MLRKRRFHNVPQTCPQSSTPYTKFNLSINHVANENWLPNPRLPTNSPPTPDPHRRNSVQLALATNDRVGRTRKREATAPIPGAPRKRIAHSEIYPARRASSDRSHQAMRRGHRGGEALRNSGQNTRRRDAAETGVAQLSIPWEILTPGKTRIQDRPLAADRILTMVQILTRILVLARILTGTPMPAQTLTRIKLVRTLNRIIILARILTSVPNRPVRTPGPWRPIVPSVPSGWVRTAVHGVRLL